VYSQKRQTPETFKKSTMTITTLQSSWEKYRTACYPDGITAIQDKECRQAFFMGALCLMGIMNAEVATIEDLDKAAEEMEKLCKEAHAECGEYAKSNFSPNN
jgi:hypothetical protein